MNPRLVTLLALAALLAGVAVGDSGRPPTEAQFTATAEQTANPQQLTGALVTRMSNLRVGNGIAFTFDAEVSDQYNMWNASDPTVLTIPWEGWWWVGVNATTLGTSYGGPSNLWTIIEVVRNWDGVEPHLDDNVAFERFYNGIATSAFGNSLLQLVYLKEGDRLQVLFSGPAAQGLLVESNPSDGQPSGFLTDSGPGTLSPHFYVSPV